MCSNNNATELQEVRKSRDEVNFVPNQRFHTQHYCASQLRGCRVLRYQKLSAFIRDVDPQDKLYGSPHFPVCVEVSYLYRVVCAYQMRPRPLSYPSGRRCSN